MAENLITNAGLELADETARAVRVTTVGPTGLASDGGGVLAAGEAHVGEVGSPTAYLTSTPTLTVASGYTTNDYVGPSTTPASFANAARVSGGKLVIKSLTITDKTTTAAVALELWLFSATVTVPADSAAWSISDADNLLCVGVIPITADKWYASALNKVYSDDSLSKVVKCAATSLFYALVARGVPPAWADQDLALSIGVLQG